MESGTYKQANQKHLHVIGICGVATSALAIAFHKKGWKVTGSDKGFFPPVSTELEKHGISFYAGWHPEKMIAEGVPDLVVVTTASGSTNPETLYAKEHGLDMRSYTEVFRDYFIKDHSIVCAGTWGKTSSATLLSHILLQTGMEPGYMFGGISLSHDGAASIGSGEWSVFEGDEYKSGPNDPTAKFFYYKPTHLLLSAVSWDHADLYPTEESYFDAFKKLVIGLPDSGFIVARKAEPGIDRVLEGTKKKIIWYGATGDYSYSDVQQSKEGLRLMISHAGTSFDISSQLLGTFQAENITGCFAMAREIGIPAEKIIAAISSFKGMKRRLEKRLDGDVAIIDDIAHSPEKASVILKNLRGIYSGKVFAIFEPNIGGRRIESIAKYDNAFKDADTVIIPRLTKLKVAENESDKPLEGDDLVKAISKTHSNAIYLDDDAELVDFLVSNAKKSDVIAFLGSHGFRGMIEATCSRLLSPPRSCRP